MKKSVIATLITVITLMTIIGPAFFAPTVHAADPSDWYMTTNGVLTSDNYMLYPYETESLDFGLSKYGEMISYPVTPGIGVGLQYPGYESVGTYDQKKGTSRDAFANEYIDPKLWLNGWLIDIRYTHRTLRDRQILAMAMFADMAAYGGEWIVGHPYPFHLAPHGGRKTTAYAETEDLLVLYDGPREMIAVSRTRIYDWLDSDEDGVVEHPDETWAILDVVLTFIFNKVKKQVIILKDIKLVISGKELASPVDVQFSNREEWDLGPPPAYASYGHFYHQALETCYGPEWHLAPGILREWVEEGYGLTSVPVWREPFGGPIAAGSVRVYVNGQYMEEGEDYTIDYETGEITWNIPIDYEDWVTVVYKLWKYYEVEGELIDAQMRLLQEGDGYWEGGPDWGVPHLYDVAQIISSDKEYVGWKAFWPTLSDYTVDGWERALTPLIWINQSDFVPITDEPDIPFVIGEWDFMLGKDYPLQFRGVEVVGLTGLHDGEDAQMGEGYDNVLDREAMYQLTEIFNPFDLESAVHKQAARWVEWPIITSYGQTFTTDAENVPVIVRPDPMTSWVQIGNPLLNEWIPDPEEWDQYSVFSERIYNLYTGQLLVRGVDYDITQLSTGRAQITFYVTGSMKILYSTMGMYMTTEDNANNTGTYGVPDYDMDWYLFGDDAEAPIEFYIKTPAPTQSWKTATLKIRAEDVDLEDSEIDAVYLNGHLLGVLQGSGGIDWAISEFEFPGEILDPTGWQFVQIFVDCDASYTIPYTINPFDNATWPTMYEEWGVEVDWGAIVFNYAEYIPMPRYEWITVGRDAASVDSAGAALVAAAFKDKQVEIGIAGADMYDSEIANQLPWIMHKYGTGDTWPHYYYDNGEGDYRTALKDDWCHTWPITSSNLIGIGGPLANMLSYYANDFTDAFYGMPAYTAGSPYQGGIVGKACWMRGWNATWNVYESSLATGYAVISTYKDINGTVMLVIWGHWGRDTYYATKWFKEEGIFQLQEAPKCITSLILEIDYTSTPEGYKPTGYTIVEALGTISETLWIHGSEYKGGIHDP
ncbi:MAG: hypothetical protein ACLFU9_01345 [Candidatus Bathyarchaeia archaeon]